MAKIEFKGFVEKHEGNRPWTIAEGHSVKDGDKWVVKARTFHKVWLPKGLSSLSEGALVTVTGTQKTVVNEYQGEKKYDLVVYADSVADKDGKVLDDGPVGGAGYDDGDEPF